MQNFCCAAEGIWVEVQRQQQGLKGRFSKPWKGWSDGKYKILVSGALERDHGLVRRPGAAVSVWCFVSAHHCRNFVFFAFLSEKNYPVAARHPLSPPF
jgi:hypothetical protein